MNKKILSLNQLKKTLKKLKNKKIVFSNGCFDILHAGHVRYLSLAKSKGDVLIIGLNSDSSVKRLKGPKRPINCQKDRAQVLSALESVDFVVYFSDDTPIKLIKLIKPDVLVKGSDWKNKNIVGSDIVKSSGGKVLTVPFLPGRSTTATINKIGKL